MIHARKQRNTLIFGSFSLMLVVACGRVLGTDFDNLYPAQAGAGGAGMGGSSMGGSSMGGSSMGGSNMGGSNMGGSNMGGSSMGGSNMGGSNMGGSLTGEGGEIGGVGGTSCQASASDFFVDPNAASGDCQYLTITAALDAAKQSKASNRTVHVAAGTYSTATNERFPLDLTHGISLVGAGASETVIEGLGNLDHSVAGGQYAEGVMITIHTGDDVALTRIANLRLLSGQNDSLGSSSGIFCDRGNGRPPGEPHLDPTLIVDGVTFDAQYEQSLAVTNALHPTASACNVRVISSTFRNSVSGITNNACDGSNDTETHSSLEIGDGDPAHANLFDNIGSVDNVCRAGVRLFGCSSYTSIRNNSFSRGASAIYAAYGLQTNQYLEIIGNTFDSQADGSLLVFISAQVDELSSNQFKSVNGEISDCWWDGTNSLPSAAIYLYDAERTASPRIAHARNNTFIGNRTAIHFEGNTEFEPSDFGTVDDPGGNVFSCNSNVDGFGSDVWQSAHTAAGKPMLFAGNYWDHGPPTVSSTRSNGLDYWLDNGGPPPLLDKAKVANAACPANYVKGP